MAMAKHPVRFEHVGQHPPVAGLKDVKGKDRTGKQRGVAQNHQRGFARNQHRKKIHKSRKNGRNHTN
jgi:hypothetical protein